MGLPLRRDAKHLVVGHSEAEALACLSPSPACPWEKCLPQRASVSLSLLTQCSLTESPEVWVCLVNPWQDGIQAPKKTSPRGQRMEKAWRDGNMGLRRETHSCCPDPERREEDVGALGSRRGREGPVLLPEGTARIPDPPKEQRWRRGNQEEEVPRLDGWESNVTPALKPAALPAEMLLPAAGTMGLSCSALPP